ncbi:ADP-ribosylglycohydrolase family protein [Botrimarina mediterranea]|uniref:Glycosyl hydrolases family 43 n=2 Tax=Botrimarina mediterranea TaxID=2528022 RepID=A0A518K8B6_9BACT|nr:Glycosyl hydrolases family 43 [Botrimarina mediterranea]QDV78665.1 Glycosyl hydrolases family 43 [Planctomycetes bacterium K2D]
MHLRFLLLTLCLFAAIGSRSLAEERRLPLEVYVDKMKAGWLGQMAGVGWGFPTEFRFNGKIIPAAEMPAWTPEMINQYDQDDLYVEMTFLRTLEQHGLGCSIRQAGIDFANSGYPLWHANDAGRTNLRRGIAPPASGSPPHSDHTDDIDYQIEADYSGLIAPGLPQSAIDLGEKFGRLMNFGDGVYGGQFVGAMYAEAFFEEDPKRIIAAALRSIPAESQYAEMVRDVVAWHEENPEEWEAVWRLVEAKYHKSPGYVHGLCCGPGSEDHFCIDVKLNGAYILIGMLYGERDPDRTITIATRCGQDSDCNPSNAAGVLFTTMGTAAIPERYTSALQTDRRFSHTTYTFDDLVRVTEKLSRETVLRYSGRIEMDADGNEVLVVPVSAPKPSKLEASHSTEPVAEERFTADEMAQIETAEAAEKQPTTLVESGEFIHIYDPGVDEEEAWYVNDHCFIQDSDGLWHLFGITHAEPLDPADEDDFAHATATTLLQQPWNKRPFALSVATEAPWREEHLWAPHVIEHDGLFYMYYCAGDADHSKYKLHLATSADMKEWTRHPENPMVVDGYDARDPFLLRHDGKWLMYYTANAKPEGGNHIVACVESDDLLHWGERRVVYTDTESGTFGGPTESPFVVRRGDKFYLFIGPRGGYDGTDVFVSDSPYDWKVENQVGHIPSHAAEVVRDEKGDWWVSRAGWGRGGVYLAPLTWRDGLDDAPTNVPVAK